MKMMLMILITALTPALSFAQIVHAPPSFQSSDGYAVFTDFQDATYDLTYDPATKKATAHSLIHFETIEEGMPAFDMIETPTQFLIDGVEVQTKIISSNDKDTWFKIALKSIKPGKHTFEVVSPIKEGVSFTNAGVSSAFWFNDLGDRALLEAYVPSNFEFDQFKIIFNIDFKTMNNQKITTNGSVTKISDDKYKVEFPETYTSSSMYFHTSPVGRYPERNFTFPSVDGREIPVTIYTIDGNLDSAQAKVTQVIQDLESKYGPWMHKKIIVFIAGNGGMEYCGATMSDMGSLSHELTHSYFARGGFMPANGNAGWIDEAITTWSDSGAAKRPDLNGVVANMAGNSPYRRYTDNRAYSTGAAFMAYLNYHFEDHGGLSAFLNNMIQTTAFSPMTTEEFSTKMSFFYSEDLTELFRNHVYKDRYINEEDPYKRPAHMKMTIPEMKKYL